MRIAPLQPLTDEQARAADPARNVWVAASAGSGKTQVLAARILRLMLAGVPPERILALTFTRAAAAEMQARVLTRLAAWARWDAQTVAADLAALRAPATPQAVARAQALLDAALDVRGGLAIRTIHAFAQSLLGAFPFEAGLSAGFELADDRATAEAVRAALAEAAGQPAMLADLEAVSVQRGPSGVLDALDVLRAHRVAIAGLGDPSGFEARMRALLDRPRAGSPESILAEAIAAVDWGPLGQLAQRAATGGGKRLESLGTEVLEWLAGDTAGRARKVGQLLKALLTEKGEARSHQWLGMTSFERAMPGAGEILARAQEQALALRALHLDLANADCAARHLRLGHAHAGALQRASDRAGTVDFDDLLERAGALLSEPGGAAWVRRKLDQRFDHILLDEAQDSNARQWAIVEALLAEHGAGEGEAQAARSVFAVGDFKQSIFGFQGAAPAEFLAARQRLEARGLAIETIDLATNFRSTQAVLTVVDRVLGDLGAPALGLERMPPRHFAARRGVAGEVLCLAPVAPEPGSADESEAEGGDDGEAHWDAAEEAGPAGAAASPDERLAVVTPAERIMARRLAGLLRAWLDDPAPRPSTGRRLAPGDVLILVRRRADLIAALGAALQEAGIPVAGPDRLMLTASLAVKDMLSLMRVMLQPADDLALCEVLTSPMGALDHDALLPLAAGRRPGERVWDRLGASQDLAVRDIADWLAGLRAQVDFLPPSAWLRHVLDHPRRGARAITARVGPAAFDQLGELLNAAREHERGHPPGMRGFLGWLLRHDVPIKRDPDAPGVEVRLMTVHAAKGLQAPVVILADAAARPRDLRDPWLPVEADGATIPFFHAGRPTLGEGLAQARERRIAEQAQEEARLLYVAMTRAEDCLVVTGALSRKDWSKEAGRHVPHPESWWTRVRAAVEAEGGQAAEIAGWPDGGWRLAMGSEVAAQPRQVPAGTAFPLPVWATHPVAPPGPLARPLSPSRLVPQPPADPPDPARARAAAQRGRLLHLLFERVGMVRPDERPDVLSRLAARHAPELDEAQRQAIVAEALAVLALPEVAPLFGPDALPEAMLAGEVAGQVIAGRIDRLLIAPGRVQLLEFKSSRRVPASVAAIHPGHLAQIAAYRALCRQIWPERAVEAALLFTAGPVLFALDAALLDSHAPGAA